KVEPDIVVFLYRPTPFDVDTGFDHIQPNGNTQVLSPRIRQRLDRDVLGVEEDLDLGEAFTVGIPGIGEDLLRLLDVLRRVVVLVPAFEAVRHQLTSHPGVGEDLADHVTAHAERERLAYVDVFQDTIL